MKYITLLCLLMLKCLPLHAQSTRQANIKISQFYYDGSHINLACTVEIENLYSMTKRYLIFFIKSQSGNIRMIDKLDENNYYAIPLENVRSGSYRIGLTVPENTSRLFEVYPVVIQGDFLTIKKVAPLVDSEFNEIEPILDVLNRARLSPLTYTKFEYPQDKYRLN